MNATIIYRPTYIFQPCSVKFEGFVVECEAKLKYIFIEFRIYVNVSFY